MLNLNTIFISPRFTKRWLILNTRTNILVFYQIFVHFSTVGFCGYLLHPSQLWSMSPLCIGIRGLLGVSLCWSGSAHVIEDKCPRVNCSVLQIQFPNEPIDQKGDSSSHGPSYTVVWRKGLHRSLKGKNDMSLYYHVACCGWTYFDQRPVTGMSQFISQLCWLSKIPAIQSQRELIYESNT